MKATLVLAMMLQYQAEAGQIGQVTRFSAAGCASSDEHAQEYLDAGVCKNFAGSSETTFFLTITCNAAGQASATKYSDSMCQNVDTAFSNYGYTAGVHNHAGACVTTADPQHETVACVTADTVSITRYTDAACTVAKTGADATGNTAVNGCAYGTLEGGSIMAEKNTVMTNGTFVVHQYTNKDCTGTGTPTFMIHPNVCQIDSGSGGSLYMKWDGTVSSASGGSTGGSSGSSSNSSNSSSTSAPAKATASKTTLQRGYLALPLFMGVVAFLF